MLSCAALAGRDAHGGPGCTSFSATRLRHRVVDDVHRHGPTPSQGGVASATAMRGRPSTILPCPPRSPRSSTFPSAPPGRRAASPSATRSPRCLRDAAGDEVEIVVAYLAGETRQGRIGVGWATLAGLRGTPASAPSLTLREVDGALAEVAATAGKGSAAARNATPACPVRARHRGRAGASSSACSSASCARARSKA